MTESELKARVYARKQAAEVLEIADYYSLEMWSKDQEDADTAFWQEIRDHALKRAPLPAVEPNIYDARTMTELKCPYDDRCGIMLRTQAETFLHRELHRETGRLGDATTLNVLPFVLMPRIARMMQDYAEFMMRREAGEETLEGWPVSAGFAPRELPRYEP